MPNRSRPTPFDLATATLAHEERATFVHASERRYLLVFEGDSSLPVPLPPRGEIILGRSPEAGVHVHDAGASRSHAKIVLDEAEMMLVDLGSRNGTHLNGERIIGARPLRRGDVIAIGSTSIVVHRDGAATTSRVMLDEPQLRRRADEEIARLTRNPQILAVIALRIKGADAKRGRIEAALGRELRAIDVAAWGVSNELIVLVPDLDEEPEETARRLIAALTPSAQAHAGVAQYPSDGVDFDTLLSAARTAADSTPSGSPGTDRAGTVNVAGDTQVTRTFGDRTFVVVEPTMLRIYALLERLAKSGLPVLITGETGTGKENAAAAIHHGSDRARGPFVIINCAALPESLVESELFGHEKGSFSGATTTKTGLLEAATGGTVFLDEVGELPLATQAKLLRVLETQRLMRVGGLSERAVDVRFVAATNRDLVDEVREGRFRQDVLFRLGAATIVLPPLRDRRRELPVLARTLLGSACTRARRAPLVLAPLTMQKLLAHAFPGNVRELKNAMEYVAATAEGPVVEPWELPVLEERLSLAPAMTASPIESVLPPAPGAPSASRVVAAEASGPFRPLADEIRELEKKRIVEALAASGGVQARAAELIGMPIRTLFGKMKLYGISSRGGAEARSS